jgi:hypothetical protein
MPEVPTLRIPGRVLHLYTSRGVYRGAWLESDAAYRPLSTIELAPHMVSNHLAKEYLAALKATLAAQLAPETAPAWQTYAAAGESCACCAAPFTWEQAGSLPAWKECWEAQQEAQHEAQHEAERAAAAAAAAAAEAEAAEAEEATLRAAAEAEATRWIETISKRAHAMGRGGSGDGAEADVAEAGQAPCWAGQAPLERPPNTAPSSPVVAAAAAPSLSRVASTATSTPSATASTSSAMASAPTPSTPSAMASAPTAAAVAPPALSSEAVERSWAQMACARHHCRACGRVVCDGCSRERQALPRFGIIEPVRCCDACFFRL